MLPPTLRRAWPWVLRAWWAALPFTVGPALGHALAGNSGPVRTVASVGLWAGWAAGLGGTLVPHPVSLTALRVLAPAATMAAVAASIGDRASVLAVAWSAVATALAFAPDTGLLCVNGPAYPNERRLPLRAPAPLLVGPVVVAWAVAVAGAAGGPLLLAARRWVWGGLACAVGLPLSWLLLRSLHQLSKRWVVFVPAGFVLVDPLGLTDTVLVRRQHIRSLGPAPAESTGLDLTQRAPGLVLEVALSQPVDVGLVRPGRRAGEARTADRLLFTPTLPGAVLDEAKARRLG